MRLLLFAFMLSLMLVLFSLSGNFAMAEFFCSEGERRVCGPAVGACQEIAPKCTTGSLSDCALGYAAKTGEPCGSGVGICQSGRSVCDNGNWTACQGNVGPRESEICGNGIDDDCDGAVDEDCFPWVTLMMIGVVLFFASIAMYYAQRGKDERLESGGVSKD